MQEPQSRMMNIIAMRFEITNYHLTRDAHPKGMVIKITDGSIKINLAFLMKTKQQTQVFPSVFVFFSEETKGNTVIVILHDA